MIFDKGNRLDRSKLLEILIKVWFSYTAWKIANIHFAVFIAHLGV